MLEELDWSSVQFDDDPAGADMALEAVAGRPWYVDLARAIDAALDCALGAK